MRATTVTVGPLATPAANNIALSQTPTTTFTLNGSLVTSGVATLDTPRRVLFTQAASESGKTYTIVGTSDGNVAQTEVLSAAASATTVYSALDFKTVTSITMSSAAAGAITVGTNGVASSRPIRMDGYANAQSALQVTVSGTVNYSVQTSMDDPNSPFTSVAPYAMTWIDSLDPNVVAATGNVASYIAITPTFVRLLLNSETGTGSVSMTITQLSAVPA
jgi:hypothetical protein